jgi:hypothetical protein
VAWRPSHLSQQSLPSSLLLLPFSTNFINDCNGDARTPAAETDATAAAAAAPDDDADDDEESSEDDEVLLDVVIEAAPRKRGRLHCGMACKPLLLVGAARSEELFGGLEGSVRETQQPMRIRSTVSQGGRRRSSRERFDQLFPYQRYA